MIELIKKSDALHAVLHNEGQAAVAAVENIKAVDAVPVCRCFDCKWCEYHAHNSTKYGCKLFDRCVKPDWFCADGERTHG